MLFYIVATCGPGTKKACKDCTCGFAEELSGGPPKPKEATSACGSVSRISYVGIRVLARILKMPVQTEIPKFQFLLTKGAFVFLLHLYL